MRARLLTFVSFFIAVALLPAAEPERKQEAPNRLRPQVVVIPATWARQIPPTLRVNAPTMLSTIHPGQHIDIAIMAEGPNRDALLKGLTIRARVSNSRAGTHEKLMKPATVRQIADWLGFWQTDTAVPERIRREIASLASNPAFQKK